MQIQQLQVAADPVQDRLLLRLATASREEVRVYITRRFLRELWPGLAGMLLGHLGQPRPTAPAGGEAAPAGHFDAPFRSDDPTFPLGSNPLLPAEAQLAPAGDGACSLTLREARERSLTLTLDANLLQALCAMLRAGSDSARWDLPLEYGTPAPAAAPAKTLLH